MSPVDRMVALGMFPHDAASIEKWFLSRDDREGLERYISDKKNFNPEASDR